MNRILLFSALFPAIVFFVTSTVPLSAQEDKPQNTDVRQAMDKAVSYLRSTQQPSGAWQMAPPANRGAGRNGGRGGRSISAAVGPTAVILAGLFDAGLRTDDPMMQRGMDFLKFAAQEDGGIYTRDGFFQNYETCVAVMCFAVANEVAKKERNLTGTPGLNLTGTPGQGGPYDELLQRAQKYLRKNQFVEDRDVEPDDMEYGGIGYGGDTRPDLSNTQFFLDALVASGASKDDPAIQKALVFVSRCQNLESEHNTQVWAASSPDGGFVYTTESSTAGETESGGLRSYASMTYAGFKSMIYAGLTKDDKRVKAAFEWITKHYSVTENPGLGQTGLYYYYHTMAKALDTLGTDEIEDAAGKKHAWKTELSAELLRRQRDDGSWINDASAQYMENDANLVTGFVLLVLAYCLKE